MQSPNIIYWLCSRPAPLSALSFSLLHQFFHLLCLQGLKRFAKFNNVFVGRFPSRCFNEPIHPTCATQNQMTVCVSVEGGGCSSMFEGNLVSIKINKSYPMIIFVFCTSLLFTLPALMKISGSICSQNIPLIVLLHCHGIPERCWSCTIHSLWKAASSLAGELPGRREHWLTPRNCIPLLIARRHMADIRW